MNELQMSLLAIGLLVVAGVYGFNRLQERKYRRLAEEAFPSKQEDVLLRESETSIQPNTPDAARFREEPRIEPVISAVADEPVTVTADEPVSMDEPVITEEPLIMEAPVEEAGTIAVAEPEELLREPVVARQEDKSTPLLDETIAYAVQLHPGEPVAAAALVEAAQRKGSFGKQASWLAANPLTGAWEEIGQDGTAAYRQIAATLLLADRSGPVSEPDLADFCNRVQAVADKLAAIAEFPDRQAALVRAAALDQFCADVDVLIGVNVITQDGEAFAATKVRALAEAAGMKLQTDGAFHFINEEGADLFSLANLDPTPFSAENIRHLSSHGITFLFDVPRVADGMRVFNQMLLVAKQMASTLGGKMADDNRRPLTEPGIARIKQQLADIYARMEARQIKSGSVRALRLFS